MSELIEELHAARIEYEAAEAAFEAARARRDRAILAAREGGVSLLDVQVHGGVSLRGLYKGIDRARGVTKDTPS